MCHRHRVISTFFVRFSQGSQFVIERIGGEFRRSPFLSHVVMASVEEEQSVLKSTQTHAYLH